MGNHKHGAQDVRRLSSIKCMYAFEYGRFDESGLTTRIGQNPLEKAPYLCFLMNNDFVLVIDPLT